jgi:hypothetical protein
MTMNLTRAEEARESRKKTRMKGLNHFQIHPAGEAQFLSACSVLFAFIRVIRGQIPD